MLAVCHSWDKMEIKYRYISVVRWVWLTAGDERNWQVIGSNW